MDAPNSNDPIPAEFEQTKEVLNLMRSCPYVSLDVAAEVYGVVDIEQLIFNLQVIENHKSAQK